MITPHEDLANAIILQAVRDWRKAVGKLKKWPRYRPATELQEECEEFFLSDWFTILTKVDGSDLLWKLKKEEGIDDE